LVTRAFHCPQSNIKEVNVMNQKIKAPFSIGAASRMTAVTRKQIRSWEARGYIPEAYRVVCGERAYRYFTPEQIETIRKIKGYLDQGYTLAHASKMARNGK
jgi:DNA-binding transcriptional MerR regulator